MALRDLVLPSGNNLALEPGKNLVLPPTDFIVRGRTIRTPYPVWAMGGRVFRGTPMTLPHQVIAPQVMAPRNLTLPSGNNLALQSGRNLVLPPIKVIPRSRTARTPYPVWMLGGRAVRNSSMVLSLALPHGEVLLSQRFHVRANRTAMLIQNVSARAKRLSAFTAQLRAVIAREAMLAQDLHAFARSGYRLFAFNLATGDEAYIGFLPADGPLTLDNVALADGDYEIRVRADGCYWRDARFTTAFPITIEGGEIAAPLPAITGLKYSRVGESLLISWTWLASDATQTPHDFAIWIATSLPVDTSGEPDQVVPVLAPGGYSTMVPDSTETRHVAACARRDGKTGPVSTITIAAPEILIESPDNQTAWFERNP